MKEKCGCAPGARAAEEEAALKNSLRGDTAWGRVVHALDDPERLCCDVELDWVRVPVSVLKFCGVEAGWRALDFGGGRDYWGNLIRLLTGVETHSFNPSEHHDLTREWRAQREASQSIYQNPWHPSSPFPTVTHVMGSYTNLCPALPPHSFDLIFCYNSYHDTLETSAESRAAMNNRLYTLLSPTGCLVVADHDALSATHSATLHRISRGFLVKELEAAGFALSASNEALQCDEDDKRFSGWVPTSQPHTDRFLFKFVKTT